MKVKYTTPNNRITVELEADTQVEVFSQLSAFQEVFGETNCGKCGSDNLKFQIRNVDDNEFLSKMHYYFIISIVIFII